MRRYESYIYSTIGLIALAFALVGLNYLTSRVPVRLDLTKDRLFTLSDGTRKILSNLDGPVKVKFYVSHGDLMPVPLRGYVQHIQDMLREFRSVAGGNLTIEEFDPLPDSDIEDAAQLDGIEAQQLQSGETFYTGIAMSRLDRKQVIPALSSTRESLLEYDLVRAVAKVSQSQRPVVGVLGAVPVLGGEVAPTGRQPKEGDEPRPPWALAGELADQFDLRPIKMGATSIPDDIGVVLVIHPRDIAPQTEFALDQFVLRGGKLVAFLDPFMYFDIREVPGVAGGVPGGTVSTLPTLFKAWGVDMPYEKVIADLSYATGAGQRYSATILGLNRDAFNKSDVITNSINALVVAFPGAFEIKPPEGITLTELIRSSANSALVDRAEALRTGDESTRGFKAEGKRWTIAARLTGKFRTAFPGGMPGASLQKDNAAPALRESATENSVTLVADADMLTDQVAVTVQTVRGQRTMVPNGGNLAFAMGLIEHVAAGNDLASLRARASSFHPLIKVRVIEGEAQRQYVGQINAMQDDLQAMTKRMREIQRTPAGGKPALLTPAEQAESEQFKKRVAETKLALRDVRKQARREADRLVFWTKIFNIATMPTLVALAGLLVALVRRRRALRAQVA